MTQRVVNYTYGTGNPVLPNGSIDVRDGIDNLQSMDVFMNAPEDTYNQRDGEIVRTVTGMNNEFDAQILNMGFTRIGTFASGATLTNPRQTLLWDIADGGDGQEYGWSGSFPKVVPATSTPASTGGISVGAWMSRFDPELRTQVREALRRSYAEAGYNLVDGSFEAGGTLVNANDVLLQERTGKAFSGPTGAVAAGTNPASGGFVDRSGALLRSRLVFNALDFGAAGDGTTDDSPAFVAAILYAALAGGGRIIAPYRHYKLASTVVVPSCVELDFCNSEIIGPGLGSSVDVFQSGYLSGGAVISNIGAPPETILVRQAAVKNAFFRDCGKVFNFYNFLDGSELFNLRFSNCTQPLYADRCFYGRFINLFSRGSAGGTLLPAFYFRDFVNVCAIESVFAVGRVNGIEISSGANGQTLYNCSAEECTNGIIISGETGPIKLDTCYIEGITGNGVDLSAGGFKYDVTFDNCFFNQCAVGINRGTNGTRVHVHENNRFLNTPIKIKGVDNFNDFGEVEIAPVAISNNGYPSIPSGYEFGGKSRVRHENVLFDSSTGLALIKTQVHGNTIVPFNYEGKAGGPKAGTVAFCEHSKTAGTTFSVIIDTKIAFNKHAALLAYRITIADEIGAYELFGNTYGDKAKAHDGLSKTVAVSNNGGFIRLTFDSFYSAVQTYSCTGVVRHV